MGLIELICFGVSSVVMIVVSKTKLNVRNDCLSCSYNTDFYIDTSRPTDEVTNEEESNSDNDELHCDSFTTLPPPPPPVFVLLVNNLFLFVMI